MKRNILSSNQKKFVLIIKMLMAKNHEEATRKTEA
jgi:hypothetical protein